MKGGKTFRIKFPSVLVTVKHSKNVVTLNIRIALYENRRVGPTGSPVRGIIERPDFFLPGPSSSERQMMSSSEEYRRFFWADFGLGLGLGLALPLPRAPGTEF